LRLVDPKYSGGFDLAESAPRDDLANLYGQVSLDVELIRIGQPEISKDVPAAHFVIDEFTHIPCLSFVVDPQGVQLLGAHKPLFDQIEIMFWRGNTRFGLLLKSMEHVDRFG